MTIYKRLFDLSLLLISLPVTGLLFVIVCLCVFLRDGRPIFYKADRMSAPRRIFCAYKFRTMSGVGAEGVSGGDKQHRVTKLGIFLRRSRLDELPQLYSIFKGDMSFVGPRPPDPYYAKEYPEIYDKVLQNRPGLTGLATLYIHRHEEHLLAACTTAAETDAVYRKRCIPRKAHLDLIYQKHRNQKGGMCLDIWILAQSVLAVLR